MYYFSEFHLDMYGVDCKQVEIDIFMNLRVCLGVQEESFEKQKEELENILEEDFEGFV